MVSSIEYEVAKIAYGELDAVLHCMRKMDATPADYDYVFFNNQSDIFTKQAAQPQPPVDPNTWQSGETRFAASAVPSTQVPGIGEVQGMQGTRAFRGNAPRAMRGRGSDVAYTPTSTMFGRTTQGGPNEGAGYTYTNPETGQVTRVAPSYGDRFRDWAERANPRSEKNIAERAKAKTDADALGRTRMNVRRGRLSPEKGRLIDQVMDSDDRKPSYQSTLDTSGEKPELDQDAVASYTGVRQPPVEMERDASGTFRYPTEMGEKVPASTGRSLPEHSESLMEEATEAAEKNNLTPPKTEEEAEQIMRLVVGEYGPGTKEAGGFRTPVSGFVSQNKLTSGARASDMRRKLTAGGQMLGDMTAGAMGTDPKNELSIWHDKEGNPIQSLEPVEQGWNALGESRKEGGEKTQAYHTMLSYLSQIPEEKWMEAISQFDPYLAQNREALMPLIQAAREAKKNPVRLVEGQATEFPGPDTETLPEQLEFPDTPPEELSFPDDDGKEMNIDDSVTPEQPGAPPKGKLLDDEIARLEGGGISDVEGRSGRRPPPTKTSSDPLQSAWDHLTILKAGDE